MSSCKIKPGSGAREKDRFFFPVTYSTHFIPVPPVLKKRLICKYFSAFPPVNNWLLVAIFWVLSKALEKEPVRIEIIIVWQKSKPPKLNRNHMTLSIYILNNFFRHNGKSAYLNSSFPLGAQHLKVTFPESRVSKSKQTKQIFWQTLWSF